MSKSIRKIILSLASLHLLFLVFMSAGYAQSPDSTLAGIAEVKIIRSSMLNENRTIYIHTPTRMKANETYPVLYALDGEAFIHLASGQVQYLSESYKVIPQMIIVGIVNTDRIRDLTPTHSIIGPNGKPDTSANAFGKTSGGGEQFLEFMQKELMPFIETHYATAPYKILAGHSLGGLMAVHALVNRPNLFNAYIAISPSLQWDNEVMLKQASDKLGADKPLNKILFFSDANEGNSFHENQLKLDTLLKQKQVKGLKYKYAYYPEETHISEPVKALYDGLRHIYPNWYLAYSSSAFKQSVTSKTVIDHFSKLSADYGYKVIPTQEEVIQLGKFLRRDPQRINEAIIILETYTKDYTQSAIMFELLGDCYTKTNDLAKALINYKKAFALDNTSATLKEKIGAIPQQQNSH
jgi:predicted alpha/beta superfamily hydrolase